MGEGNPFISVATFSTPIEAHLARNILEEEGIEAIIADEHLGDTAGGYIQAIGGIRVQVRASDAEAARAILAVNPPLKGTPKANPGILWILLVGVAIALLTSWWIAVR